ncbi:hypothetical protein RLW55_05925 [Hyphomicrobium sp. B1]|uniref:hypothetical protein n=1 Tax=Hyphomicrobium sp. B1 TaxID=3075651 RepID=UPI003C2B965A
MAFHLHRLGLSTTSLRAAGLSRDLARSVREGRVSLGAADTAWLYQNLALDDGQLTRALTDDERAVWDFYRVSARHPVAVWQNAATAWRPHLSASDVSAVIGHSRRTIESVVAGKTRRPVLTYEPASRLAEALHLEAGADAFISGLPPHPR